MENVSDSKEIEILYPRNNIGGSTYGMCFAKNISYVINNGTNLLWRNSDQNKIKVLSQSGGGRYKIKASKNTTSQISSPYKDRDDYLILFFVKKANKCLYISLK